jgi:hypothetical protein
MIRTLERFDNAASCDFSAPRTRNYPVQLGAQLLQLSYFQIHGRKMVACDAIDRGTVLLGQAQQGPDVRYVEAQPSRMANKTKAILVALAKVAIVAVSPIGLREQANVLIIPNGFGLSAGGTGQLTYLHFLVRPPLNL